MERQLGEFAPAPRQSAWPAPSERTSAPRHRVAPATDAALVFAVNRPHGRVVQQVAPQRAEFPVCRLVGSGGLIDILPRFFRHAPSHSRLGRTCCRICSPCMSNLVSGPGCGSALPNRSSEPSGPSPSRHSGGTPRPLVTPLRTDSRRAHLGNTSMPRDALSTWDFVAD